jgi:poly(hydroxyalkanoate) depolymerase family esterase
VSLADNIEFLRQLPKPREVKEPGGLSRGLRRRGGRLSEVTDFGSNPGDLRMFAFAPPDLPPAPALVVVLHGCTQTAGGYDLGAGWSALAERYGFALVLPEQKASNNANTCFNWFLPQDIARDSGEACSIRQIIERASHDFAVDRRRIFVTGLSAGGAMSAVMLATYPEVFAAGAIIAGLPYGIARNVQEALRGMFQSPSRAAGELGEMVRNASKHKGPWPKLSVWHGSADRTVNPSNADEIVKQWLDVHQLPSAPMAETIVDGYPRQVWWNGDGETVIESYTITNMPHGTPLGVAANDERYGAEGAFLIEAGISSSYHIATFFGLTKRPRQPKLVVEPVSLPALEPIVAATPARSPESSPAPKPSAAAAPPEPLHRATGNVRAVLARALAAIGLTNKGGAG